MASNIPEFVKTAISKANSVDTSFKGHHTALMAMMAACAKMSIEDALDTLTLYASNRVEKSPESLCTKGTFAWFEESFGLRTSEHGKVSRGRDFDAKGFSDDTFARARAMPWFELVKTMAFKVPTGISMSAVASMAVKREYVGHKLPTKDELYAAFTAACDAARDSTRVKEWQAICDAKIASGEVKRVA